MTQLFPIFHPAVRSKGVSRTVGGRVIKGDIILFIKCYFISGALLRLEGTEMDVTQTLPSRKSV